VPVPPGRWSPAQAPAWRRLDERIDELSSEIILARSPSAVTATCEHWRNRSDWADFIKSAAICWARNGKLGAEVIQMADLKQSRQNTNIAASAKAHSKPELPPSGTPPVIFSIQSGEMINAARRPIATTAARSPTETVSPDRSVNYEHPKKKCAALSSPAPLNHDRG
jgi:hypothetical protein